MKIQTIIMLIIASAIACGCKPTPKQRTHEELVEQLQQESYSRQIVTHKVFLREDEIKELKEYIARLESRLETREAVLSNMLEQMELLEKNKE